MARYYTQEEEKLLRDQYSIVSTALISERLQRNIKALHYKARKMGLKKTYNKSRFKKGHTPWNKNISYNPGGRSIDTRFTSNSQPRNAKSEGAIWVRYEKGTPYYYTKVNGKVMPLHRHLWRKEHDYVDIPHGFNVSFVDGNTLNCTIENLTLLSKAENLRRNCAGKTVERGKTLAYTNARKRVNASGLNWVDAVLNGIV